MTSEHSYTNALINESSPYLLQHAHNPVDWMPWGEAALQKAREEDKPMLISIGYSACHWCHVMERESFEDTAVAALMNAHFICIKVDREERPDVDHIYMDAVQLMTGGGGWPLNCFALPDGRPFFGGTYFRRDQWLQVLKNVHETWTKDPGRLDAYAARLTAGLRDMDALPVQPVPGSFSSEVLQTAVIRWKKEFDEEEGGADRAPKFPLPNNYAFLLAYARAENDRELLSHVHLTLRKMAWGGIYDQVGGGFARYSTDREWKVPHFEKMLYDNGQLLSLYSAAFLQHRDPLYRQVIEETALFVEREMTTPEGGFYSALDADSEGEEGRFYVWKKEEVEDLAGPDADLIFDYFNINQKGLWEHGNYILLRNGDDVKLAAKHGITEEILGQKIGGFKQSALAARARRIHPGLDDKVLCSWNAMAARGLTDAYIATGNDRWLKLAKTNLDFLLKNLRAGDGSLRHSYKNGKSSINGYLEDYAFLIDALIRYYEATFDETCLFAAKDLLDFTLQHFDQNANGLFYFKSKADAELIARKAEVSDNVIPASNSVLATCMFKLGLLFADESLLGGCREMLASIEPHFTRHPSAYSQWMLLHLFHCEPFHEVAVTGDDCLKKLRELQRFYLPNSVFCGAKNKSAIPLLQQRMVVNKTLIYVCRMGACKLPVEDVKDALGQLDR